MKAMNSLHEMLRHRMLRFLFLTVAVIVFSSCADDLYEDGDPRNLFDFSDYPTRFSSATPEDSPSGSPRKISTDYNMKYWWTFGDKIWAKVGDEFVKNDTSDIPKPVTGTSLVNNATFYFKKELKADKYEVCYTGNGGVNGLRADSVHITPVQWQTALGAGHVGKYGDCGVATATRKDDGGYTFNLDHKVSFLLFTPRVENASSNTKLRSITITSDNTICGDYYFDSNGLDTANVKNAGRKITLNLYTVDAQGKEQYPFKLKELKETDKCLYMVLQPGAHTLSVTYELVDSLGRKTDMEVQVVTHNKQTNKYEYSYTDSIAPSRWKLTRKLNAAHSFTENGFTKVSHKLQAPIEPLRFQIPYTYYEWGAATWVYHEDGFWAKVTNGYPTNSNPNDIANYERPGMPLTYSTPQVHRAYPYDGMQTYPTNMWLCGTINNMRFKFYTSGTFNPPYYVEKWGSYNFIFHPFTDVPSLFDPQLASFSSSYFTPNFKHKEWDDVQQYHDQIYFRSVRKMPSANEMTYYLKYGDIHRDNTTLWKIAGIERNHWDDDRQENIVIHYPGYRGDTTLCRGGIWIKKKAVIEAEGHPFSTTISAYGMDLRYQSPGNNYIFRHYNEDAQVPAAEASAGAVADVKYGVPADTSKYFFLPLLGYMHNVGNSPGTNSSTSYWTANWSANKGQYKFVGAEGYYWTRTVWPNAIISGQTNAYNLHGEREAYYLRITPYYVALSWDMRANRIHGMVGNQKPDWYRTLPQAQRNPFNSFSDFENDPWFQ